MNFTSHILIIIFLLKLLRKEYIILKLTIKIIFLGNNTFIRFPFLFLFLSRWYIKHVNDMIWCIDVEIEAKLYILKFDKEFPDPHITLFIILDMMLPVVAYTYDVSLCNLIMSKLIWLDEFLPYNFISAFLQYYTNPNSFLSRKKVLVLNEI